MKETIYTIPINEAYDENCECPLCFLYSRLEKEAVEYALGAAMMEPDYRIESNKKGFCNKHFSMLFSSPNKLSLALVLDTHLEQFRSELAQITDNAENLKSAKGGFFRKNSSVSDFAAKLDTFSAAGANSCIICDKINHTMSRYIDLIVEMWKSEPDFRKKFENSKGACLPHFAALVKMASSKLNASDAGEFIAFLAETENTEFKRIQDDIHKFTLKFDYRNKDMEWGTAKDAPIRTIEKLSGSILKEF